MLKRIDLQHQKRIDKKQFMCVSLYEESNRFSSCVNYDKGCKYGKILMHSNPPGELCDDCELKQFPKTYHGCCFCRKTIRFGQMCNTCRPGFEKWLFNLFYNKNKNSKSTSSHFEIPNDSETNNWELWLNVSSVINCLIHDYEVNTKMPHIVRLLPRHDDKWLDSRQET